VTHLRKMTPEELGRKSGSKITPVIAGFEDWAVRCDNRGSGAAESSSKYANASTVWSRLARVLRNELLGAGSARSVDTVDELSLRWLDCAASAGLNDDIRSRRCFLWSWPQHSQLD